VASAVVASVALVLVSGAVELPDLEAPVADLSRSLGPWTYLAVGVFAFLETAAFVGLAVPGETAVIAGGMVAHQGDVELALLIVVVWLAAAAGDTTSFLIGRRFGRPLLVRSSRLKLGAARLARVERFYAHHGEVAVIGGRFIGFVRPVMPFVAGASRMAVKRFVASSLTGALVWAALLTGVGYVFSDSLGAAGDAVTRAALGVALLVGLLLLVRGAIQSRGTRGVHRRAASPRTRGDRPPDGDGDRPSERGPSRGHLRHSGLRSVLLVVNGRASGTAGVAARLLDEVGHGLRDQGLRVDGAVTHSEAQLRAVLAAADGRRVVLVGGDGSLHAAANAALAVLPELALIPAGRANNIARALGIPADVAAAIRLAAGAPVRPVDALHVQTPQRSLYVLEAVSAGFHAAARSRYAADNSDDLRQGAKLLAGAIGRYAPYHVDVRLDDRRVVAPHAAQLFLANMPFFGFGFEVDPGADPSDGIFEAVLIEATSRRELLVQLIATHGGRHIERRGVERIAVHRAQLHAALPLVADTTALGTTTAVICAAPGRLRIARPRSAV
jgi:membrane protein DedA with SNARE-associated domain/diacylglycerol kinase family enzyme